MWPVCDVHAGVVLYIFVSVYLRAQQMMARPVSAVGYRRPLSQHARTAMKLRPDARYRVQYSLSCSAEDMILLAVLAVSVAYIILWHTVPSIMFETKAHYVFILALIYHRLYFGITQLTCGKLHILRLKGIFIYFGFTVQKWQWCVIHTPRISGYHIVWDTWLMASQVFVIAQVCLIGSLMQAYGSSQHLVFPVVF